MVAISTPSSTFFKLGLTLKSAIPTTDCCRRAGRIKRKKGEGGRGGEDGREQAHHTLGGKKDADGRRRRRRRSSSGGLVRQVLGLAVAHPRPRLANVYKIRGCAHGACGQEGAPRRGGGPRGRPLHHFLAPDGATYVLYIYFGLDIGEVFKIGIGSSCR